MHLITILSKRSKTISWFLIHLLLLQIIPFHSLALSDLQSEKLTIENKIQATELIQRILAWSDQNNIVSATDSFKQEVSTDLKKNSVQMTSVSTTSGGGFSPVSMNDMVDPFTGDFSYTIPLMDVEGYPLTLSYNSNVNMNTEASWVGLGWNLDVGSVSREMRGIPDEFNGDQLLETTYKVKNDETTNGFKAGGYLSVTARNKIGKSSFLSPSVQVTALWGSYKNSYLGLGKTFDIGLQSSINLSYSNEVGNVGLNWGIGYSSDTKGGVGFNRSLGFSAGAAKGNQEVGPNINIGYTFGSNFNSRSGMVAKSGSFNVSAGYIMSKYKPAERDKTTNAVLKKATWGSEAGLSYGASTSVMYGTATALPKVRTNNYSESNAFIGDLYVGFTTGVLTKIGGIYEQYSSSTKSVNDASTFAQPAYGYLHSGKRINEKRSHAVVDFNRGTDFPFSERMRDLPFSTQSFDIFHVSSSGLNGQFRANRTDVGTYYDAAANVQLNEGSEILTDDDMTGVNAGVLLGDGVKVEVGYSSGIQQGEMKSGSWGSPLVFAQVPQGKSFDPTVYFKAIGELTPNDLSNYEALGGTTARRFELIKDGDDVKVSNNLEEVGTVSALNGNVPIRATAFEPMTALQMINSSNIYDQKTHCYNTSGTPIEDLRTNVIRAENHISQIKVTSTSGGIYTYGLPNYSLISYDATFSVENTGGRTYDDVRGEVTYLAGDASTSNLLGKAQLFDRTVVPAYPSSFLLTSIVGSDYIDLTNDGPSTDDVGSYHQFDYVKFYGGNNPYRWRFPISGYGTTNPKAVLNKGFLSLSTDDFATYSYSEKEVYYPKSIKGKNYIAIFVLENRKDGFGVSDENGFLDTGKPLQRLDKIILYKLVDYMANPSTAVPLNVVDFEYDYSLCPMSPNNIDTYNDSISGNTGKLTLTRIRTYAGTSKELGLSSIDFTYNPGPSYNPLNIDRWGNYKLNDPNLPNNLYPYAIQDKEIADENAKVWKLSKINTPTGGELTIYYEADNYGHVQTRRAMRHFQIEGMLNLFQYRSIMSLGTWDQSNTDLALSSDFRSETVDADNHIIDDAFIKKYGKFEKGFVPNNIIVFKLEHSIESSVSRSIANKLVKDQYFKDASMGSNAYLSQLYFNVYTKVKTIGSEDLNEITPCFADISSDYPNLFVTNGTTVTDLVSIGVMPPANADESYTYGYVVLDMINIGKVETTKKKEKKDQDILMMHPIQRFSVDFIRQNLPDIVYGTCESCSGELSVDKKALFGKEMYKYIIDQGGYVKSISPERSFVRLYEPDNNKFGGNARVTSIQINDKWSQMTTENQWTNGDYSWAYTYPERYNSKGVASYEPSSGMDENSFYNWHSYFNFAKKFPDELNFHVTPLAQQLFPTAEVGYEQVKIIISTGHKKGSVIMNFHTNKENNYKTVATTSGLEETYPVQEKSFLTGKTVDKFALTQGYSVITSDFHGKPIDVTLVDQNDHPISKTEYEYYGLGEPIPMINRKGFVTNEHVAQEYDIHLDSRFVYDESRFRMAGLTLGITFPSFKVSISPSFSMSGRERGFYSLALIKHMNYSAIVKSIKTSYMASENTAQNLLYDKYSGEVILSSLQDEYNDNLYNLSYPSHWAHPNLREIQTTYPISSIGTINSSGLLYTSFDLTEFYSSGDLIELTDGTTTGTGYILSISPGISSGSTAYIVNIVGTAFNTLSGTITFSMKKPNRTNRLTESMQSIVTKKMTAFSAQNYFPFPTANSNEEIIESSALTYRDKNNLAPCSPKAENAYVNLFANGAKGDLVMETSLSWQSERKNETDPNRTRFDGAYLEYKPFYALDANKVWTRIDQANYPYTPDGTFRKWRKDGIPTRFDRFGNVFEIRDVIGNFSAVITISNEKVIGLPVAQASNANATDIAFDGFESYSYPASWGGYFAFPVLNPSSSLSSSVRHSGKSSLKVAASGNMTYLTNITANCSFDDIPSTDVPMSFLQGENCNCPPPVFNPNPGDYIFSAWVKQTGSGATVNVIVGSGSSAVTYTALKSGPVIEGWQRVEGTCSIPSGPMQLSLKLDNQSAVDAYFDDFRIHPFLAGMTTTVYDPLTFLPLATHDGYNYATFYNYNENLQLVRVKVETTEGIKTISESNFGLSTK